MTEQKFNTVVPEEKSSDKPSSLWTTYISDERAERKKKRKLEKLASRRHNSAVKIQSMMRRFLAKEKFQKLRKQKISNEKSRILQERPKLKQIMVQEIEKIKREFQTMIMIWEEREMREIK